MSISLNLLGPGVDKLRIRGFGRGWRPCLSLSLGSGRSSGVRGAIRCELCKPQEAGVTSCRALEKALTLTQP